MTGLSITLDTTCIIDLTENPPTEFREAMEKLLILARQGSLDVAVTTRVEAEAKHPSTVEAYRRLIDSGTIKIIPSTTRLGYWKLGVDILPDENVWKSISRAVFPARNPETLFRPKTAQTKGIVDVDHLYGHLCSKRDFFVTRDGDITRASIALAALRIQVRSPQAWV